MAESENRLEFIRKLIPELEKLQDIERYIESVEERLHKIYSEYFPKVCSSCEKIYHTRAEYLEQTDKIVKEKHPDGNVEIRGQIAEFRNCKCGSTLMLLTSNRRDQSSLGKKRRELFQDCRDKLMDVYNIDSATATYIMRFLFDSMRSKVLRVRNEVDLKVG